MTTPHLRIRGVPPARRRVRFSNQVATYAAPTLPCGGRAYPASHSDPGSELVWYSPDEMQRLVHSVKPDVRAMRQDLLTDESGLCARGLEHLRSTTHLKQQMREKECRTRAVLHEQRMGGSPEDICSYSMLASRWARAYAIELAREDEAAAMEIHRAGFGMEFATNAPVGMETDDIDIDSPLAAQQLTDDLPDVPSRRWLHHQDSLERMQSRAGGVMGRPHANRWGVEVHLQQAQHQGEVVTSVAPPSPAPIFTPTVSLGSKGGISNEADGSPLESIPNRMVQHSSVA